MKQRIAADWSVESAIKAVLPTLSAFLCVLLAAVPYGIPQLSYVMPWLGIMPIYYWSIHEPRYLPYWTAFMVGLWQDVLTGGPLGLFALIFVLVRHFVAAQRLLFFKKPFLVGWWGMALVLVLSAVGGWLLASLYTGTFLPLSPFAVQTLLSIIVYPLVAWAMGGIWLVVSD
jgi:rod shape-determining protein MreD